MTYDLASVMPQPVKPKRPKWVIPVIVVLAVLALGGGAAAYFAIRSADTIAVSGTVELRSTSTSGVWPCVGTDGYADLREGTDVVATDSSGKTIGLGHLMGGLLSGNGCSFTFHLDVPAGLGFYGIEVAHRGRLQFTEADLREPLGLTLGS